MGELSFLDFLEEEDRESGEWEQESLFSMPLAPGAKARDYGLRWYQEDAIRAIRASLRDNRSCLSVMATGLGKTTVFGALAGDWTDGDVLVLAHRDELVEQARRRLEAMNGELVEVEQGEYRASSSARIVVASTQSIMQQRRLDRMGRDRFGLIIPDEAHHYIAASYRRPLDFFQSAKVAGFTATSDRADERALGLVFDDVAYVMDIEEGIDQGYLVPLRGQLVQVAEIKLDGIKTQGDADFSDAALDAVIVNAVEGIVHETLRLEPERQGIGFFPGVRSAEYAAAKFNQLRPGSAAFISGETDRDERRQITRDFKAGRYQYLCNCNVATEGFDAPNASLIIQGRPTKSRSLYAQMVGRGTRVLEGLVEGIPGKDGARDRRAVISASGKPDCTILDFVGNSGKHTLITPEDVLGGSFSEEEVALAKKKSQDSGGGDPRAFLAQARAELQRLARELKARDVRSQVRSFDPFSLFHIDQDEEQRHQARFGFAPATEGQRGALEKMGVSKQDLAGMSKHGASKLISTAIKRREVGLASLKQLRALQRFGVSDVKLTFDKAKQALDYIQKNDWGRGTQFDPQTLDHILHARRQPGED